MTIEEFLKGMGGETVTGVLAIGGIIALVTGLIKLFEPPDGFCSIDWNREKWSPKQSRNYFDEREYFEKLRAAGSRGLKNSVSFGLWLVLLLTIVVGGPMSHLIAGQSVTMQVIMASTWVMAVIVVGRWVGYRWRRSERYLAFIDGNKDWMMSRRLREK